VGAADVLILTGAPGSGKTTVARMLASRRERAVHLESDWFFHVIASGYLEPWLPVAHPQNETVMAAVADAASRYAAAGYFTVVDGIISPRWFLSPVRDSIRRRDLAVSYAILRPTLATALERSRSRDSSRLSDPAVVEQLWHEFAELEEPFEQYTVDSSGQSAAATADALDDLLGRGHLAL
jgi:tRNA uridine 5-carbamoylmethylation protein Kti12